MKNIKRHIVKSFAILFSAITLLTTTNSLTSLAFFLGDYSEKLASAIEQGDKTEVENLINEIKKENSEDAETLVNIFTLYRGRSVTPLALAAKNDKTEIARILLENDADVNNPIYNYYTPPIMYAVINKNDTLFNMLLENGTDITIPDIDNHNLFMAATNYSNDTAIDLILEKAKEIYKDEPLELKKFINSRDDNNGKSTSLMIAAASGSLSAVNAVLEAGADIEAKNKDNQNALMFAASKLKGEISVTIIKTLLKSLKNKYPNNPEKITNYILDKDTKKGRNSIDYAKRYDNSEGARILETVLREGL